MRDSDVMAKCDLIRETALQVHNYLRNGFLEKIYENALSNRLRKQGMGIVQQYPLKVWDEDESLLGEYFADMFVDGVLLVELKAAKGLSDEHTAQLLGYMRACRLRHGLLINFGAKTLQIKKLVL